MPALVLWVLLTAAPVTPAVPVSVAAPAPGVVVKLGTATLEEYQHGDPANRVLLVRGN